LIQAEVGQQGLLAGLFALQIVRTVRAGQEGVPGRIPLLIVHSLHHPEEIAGPLLEDPLKTEAVLRGEDLFPIAVAHGVDEVGKNQPAFHQVDIPVKFQGLGREQLPAQSGEGEVIGRKITLIAHIVHRIDHRQLRQLGAVVEQGAQIHGHQAGLPLLAMAHVQVQVEGLDHLHHGPGKKDEAFGVILEVPVGCAVQAFPVKQGVLADKVKLKGRVQFRLKDVRLEILEGQGDGQGLAGGEDGAPRLPHLAVQGHDHHHLVTQPRQGAGQGGDHFRQAAGAGEGVGFRGGNEDAHVRPLCSFITQRRANIGPQSRVAWD
jgi:hypothetical protein